MRVPRQGVKARPHLAELSTVVHGGLSLVELGELGLSPADVLDFSVNTNPAPVPDELRQLLAGVDVTTYPDSESRRLCAAAARAYGVSPDHVVAGNGSSELIWLVALAFLEPGDVVLLRQPTFGEYSAAARVVGAVPITYTGPLEAALDENEAKLVFVCNPNNPTGDLLVPHELRGVIERHPDTLFVADEAYADFVEGRPSLIGPSMSDNLIVLRSLTKFSALAGLRVGLAFGHAAIVGALRAVKPPWNVNALAQAAGEYALSHLELLPDLSVLASARDELIAGLRQLGLNPCLTRCNFFLVPVGDAAAVRQALLRRGCLVRDCTSFGLRDHIRIAVRTPDENRRLLEAFETIR